MDVWRNLLDLVYPRNCVVCGRTVGRGGHTLCWNCLAEAFFIRPPLCAVCGNPAEGRIDKAYTCATCARRPPRFEAARSAVRFRTSLRKALHAFKYGHATCLRRDLASLLQAVVETHYRAAPLDGVTCVPLHGQRERARTYNQSALLGQGLARRLGLPFRADLLERIRPTATQTGLNAAERAANVAGAFRAARAAWTAGRHWLLVDDTMTTGATVNACAAALKDAGAGSVRVVTVARG